MKKFLVILLLLLPLCASAQIQRYKTTSYAFANIYNGRYVWGDWEYSNLIVTINLNTDVIIIHSATAQIYKVISAGNTENDNKGGRQVKFIVYDQDGDRGNIRLRIDPNGNSQLYVDFKDCAWVYTIVRLS